MLNHLINGPADAPPLVLSPSLGSTLAMWEPQVVSLSKRFSVIRHDQRGHGGSPVPPAPYTLDEVAGDVLALLDALELERIDFCGLSLGGMVGMWLGIHAPERVGRLALCCTSARLGPPELWDERIATALHDGTKALADGAVGRWLTPGFAQRNPQVAAHLAAMVASTPDEGYMGCAAAIQHMDLLPQLHRVRAPTLVISATEDPSTPPEHGERIAAGIPGARLEVLEDAAHLANIERPDAVTALLLDHFS